MRSTRVRPSRLAWTIIAVGFALVAGGLALNVWTLFPQGFASPGGGAIKPESAPDLMRLMTLVLRSALILAIAFLVGSFVMVRIGRYFRPDPRRDVFGST